MKISRLGNRHQKNLVFIKRSSNEEFTDTRLARIARAREYIEKTRAQFRMAIENSPHRFDELNLGGGVLAGRRGKG